MASYCRVSTDKDEQLSSLENQRAFFEQYALKQGDTLVKMYADDCVIIGISGKNLIKSRVFGTCPFSFFCRDKKYYIKSQNSTLKGV